MSITRLELDYYKNIGRIATALEKIAAQGDNQRVDAFRKATGMLYGNQASTGRSEENYNYPSKGTQNVNEVPDIVKQYQQTKGGDFPKFWASLTKEQQITISTYYDR